ncbi:MAG: hypothetical protein QG670_1089 [Thermoproteota archaeon]|nr:hypothetical protein [Thermoproteota archaeon]
MRRALNNSNSLETEEYYLERIECSTTEFIKVMSDKLSHGLLLTSIGQNGKPNVMTIGWGLQGILWRKPVFMVAVRHSRYTHKLLEETGNFTVNIPRGDMGKVIDYCGTVSGRDHDKIVELGLKTRIGKMVKAPIIEDCIINYECKTIGKAEIGSMLLDNDVISSCYPKGDNHTVYYGEILATYSTKDVITRL